LVKTTELFDFSQLSISKGPEVTMVSTIEGPVVANIVDDVLGHGVPETGDRRQVGLGRHGGDFDGEVIDGDEAEGRDVGSALGDFLPPLDAASKIPVPGKVIAGGGGALQGKDIVLAVSGSPSDQTRPGRSLKVQVRPSSDWLQLSAAMGVSSNSLSKVASGTCSSSAKVARA
jgi:hypothetical protein